MTIFRRLSWLSLFIAFSFLYGQSSINELKSFIQNKAQTSLLQNAQWGLYAFYTDNGQVVIDYQSQLALAPASCLKVITTGVALKILGSNYTFTTQLLSDGFLQPSGQLNGNIFIKGSGDPTLGSNTVPGSLSLDELMANWTQALQQKGIKVITGNIIADATLFDAHPIPDNWLWVDIGNYYGASSPALSINDNLYYLIFQPAQKVGQPATILGTLPPVPGLVFENHVLTGPAGSGDNAYIYCAPGQFTARVFGTIPAQSDSFKIKGALPDPALFAAQYFLNYLQNHGIQVRGRAQTLKTALKNQRLLLLTETHSPPLKRIIEQINKRSINLYCELLLKALSVNQGGNGSTTHGTEVLQQTLKQMNVNIDGLHLSDGSGLAPTNAITPRTFAEFLNTMRKDSSFTDFFNSLSIAGNPKDIGYFKNWGVGTRLQNNARIKSGLIEGVRSHVGYVNDRKGRLLVFAFLANRFSGRVKQIDQIHEALLIKLSNLP